MIMRKPPICCIEDCGQTSEHTDVRYFGEVYRNLCDEHYEDLHPIRDRTHPIRPECTVAGCEKLAHNHSKKKNGTINWRKHCHVHHQKRLDRLALSNSISLTPFIPRSHHGDLLPFFE